MRRFINGEALLQCLVLGGMAGGLLQVLLTGQLTQYVHSRMVLYIIVALILLSGMLVFGVSDLFKPKHRLHITPYLFLVMILTLLFTSQKTIGEQKERVEKLKASKMNQEDWVFKEGKTLEKISEGNKKVQSLNFLGESKEDKGEILVIKDEDFGRWYKKIYEEGRAYEGKKIRLKGQVLRVPELRTDEFIPSRRIMVCCAADAATYGFVCRSPLASKLLDEEWVIVTGILHWEDCLGEEMPILEALQVEKAEPPLEEYATFY